MNNNKKFKITEKIVPYFNIFNSAVHFKMRPQGIISQRFLFQIKEIIRQKSKNCAQNMFPLNIVSNQELIVTFVNLRQKSYNLLTSFLVGA